MSRQDRTSQVETKDQARRSVIIVFITLLYDKILQYCTVREDGTDGLVLALPTCAA